ncbi:MAG TPA: hypothetical protein VIZ31_02515 [Vicinamibacteria bacterium]
MARNAATVLARASAAVVLSTFLGLGCSNPVSPGVVVDELLIESVDVRVLESSPPQAVAHVRGWLGDGCSEFHSLDQSRSGSTITLTIRKQRPRDAVCTAIAKLYEEDVRLQGQYPPGPYLLRVNGFEKPFTTE